MIEQILGVIKMKAELVVKQLNETDIRTVVLDYYKRKLNLPYARGDLFYANNGEGTRLICILGNSPESISKVDLDELDDEMQANSIFHFSIGICEQAQ